MKNLTDIDLLMPGLNKMAADIKALERARDEQIRCNTNHMLRIEEMEQQIKELRERVEKWEQSSIEHSKRIINLMIRLDELEVEQKKAMEQRHSTAQYGIEKRLDELERKHDKHHHWQFGSPAAHDRLASPPERPEPVVCGDCKHLTSDGYCGLASIPTTMQCFFTQHDCPEWEEKEPATPPECVCDARKREEEAGMIHFNPQYLDTPMVAKFIRGDHDWDNYTHCIHCNLPIKRSLLEE